MTTPQDPPYRLDTAEPSPGVVIARVSGELDYLGTPQLRRRLLDLAERDASVLVVDLCGVTLLSASAMEMLLAVDVLAGARNCSVRVVANTRPVLRPMTLTGLAERITLFGTLDAALPELPSLPGSTEPPELLSD